jgi:hypothetical protein
VSQSRFEASTSRRLAKKVIVMPSHPIYWLSIIYHSMFLLRRLPLWSSGQSSWQQIQRSGYDSRRYQIFWEIVSLERGPLSLVSTTEELLGRKNSGSGLEIREYGSRETSGWPRGTTLYPQNLALSSRTSGGRSVGIVGSLTQATEFSLVSVPFTQEFLSPREVMIV